MDPLPGGLNFEMNPIRELDWDEKKGWIEENSILQFNLGRVGGILEAKKISGIAEAYGIQIAPHLYCGPIVAAANIQIATCIPNFLILECIRKMDGFYSKIINKPINWNSGYVIPSKEPGLGIEINEKILKNYPYEEKLLHLQVSEENIE